LTNLFVCRVGEERKMFHIIDTWSPYNMDTIVITSSLSKKKCSSCVDKI